MITAPIAILFDAWSFIASALLVGAIGRREPPPVPHIVAERLPAETLAGLRLVFADPVLRALGLRAATASLASGLFCLYVPYAINDLHLRPAMLGLVISMGGVGAMAGALVSQRLARRSLGNTVFLGTARGAWPAGALAGGYLATRIGMRNALVVAAGGVLLSALWLLPKSVRRLDGMARSVTVR
jgi:hypothetical protein